MPSCHLNPGNHSAGFLINERILYAPRYLPRGCNGDWEGGGELDKPSQSVTRKTSINVLINSEI